MNDRTFGARVREVREAKGLTLEELGTAVGSTKSYMWELENKQNPRPSAELAYKLSQALQVPMEHLVAPAPKLEADPQDRWFLSQYSQLDPSLKAKMQAILKLLSEGQG